MLIKGILLIKFFVSHAVPSFAIYFTTFSALWIVKNTVLFIYIIYLIMYNLMFIWFSVLAQIYLKLDLNNGNKFKQLLQ